MLLRLGENVLVKPAPAASDHQSQVCKSASLQSGEGLYQPDVVLTRLYGADAEDVGLLAQAVAGADALGLSRFGLGLEARVDAAVEYLYLVGGDAEKRREIGAGVG